jgi:hypothetical protein
MVSPYRDATARPVAITNRQRKNRHRITPGSGSKSVPNYPMPYIAQQAAKLKKGTVDGKAGAKATYERDADAERAEIPIRGVARTGREA